MDKETKILSAVMKRYGSLTVLSATFKEDSDVVIVNLSDDMNDDIDYDDIENYIYKILS